MKTKHFILHLLAATTLGGCIMSSPEARHDVAVSIAAPAAMTERVITAGMFNLTTWARINKPDAPVNIYIEGDGLAWVNSHTKSLNPTPPDPLPLRLAVLDTADNVIYMARPCQYTGWNKEGPCADLYWTNGRTAPEVVQAYQQALDNIKAAYHVTGFNLIGYSGGAAVAALTAAARTDVLSLRTVAGNTDYAVFTDIHHISPADASIDPVSIASKVSMLPQQHFIGGEDKVVPAAVFDGWKQASGNGSCVQSILVPGASHNKGWVEKWPELLAIPPVCAAK